MFAEVGQAADALSYFKNYFVTGDYAAAGVGLRSTGVNGFATGLINMNGVPCTGVTPAGVGFVQCSTPGAVPADIVAAFLYWETEETSPTPVSANGFFDGNAIVGKVLGNPNNPACWSSGGTSGSSIASGRVYRADVLRYLAIDSDNNLQLANGPHTVKLPDSGGTGNGNIFLTDGASLVVVYRIVVPGQPLFAPLRAVVSYDGAYTLSKSSAPMTQMVGGFYQASASALARMTPIVANGQPSFVETLRVNGAALNVNPFTGTAGAPAGARWDNPSFSIGLAQDAASYSTQVTAGTNQVCLTFAAIWTSTNVTDTDNDGLLDTWETKGLHLNNQSSPATFGGCADYPSDPCVNLPAMGADLNKQDIFVEMDWMHGAGHLHVPKYAALSSIGTAFSLHGIAIHFDVGNNYQGQPFIVPAAYARGGDVIEESALLCPNAATSVCVFSEPYSVLGWKKGFLSVKNGFNALHIPAYFDHNRKDIFHYVLLAHALSGPFDPTGKPQSQDPKSVSGVADRPGADLMVSLGLWRFDDPHDPLGCDPAVTCADQTGSALVQAGTIMHELGHNLDLSHAGLYRAPNCMPNYPSVMNYLYQTRGLTDAFGNEHIDYSYGSLSALNESSLSETQFLGPLNYRVRFYGPSPTSDGAAKAHCDGTPINDGALEVRLESLGLSTPDWDNNGILDPGPVSVDLNFGGTIGDGVNVAAGKYFVDSNDWSSLNLQQISARLNVDGLSSDVGQADLGQADLGQADLGQADLGQADLGQADLGQADLGQADLGQADLGDVDFDTVISTLDATSSGQPLTATGKIDRITLAWGAPSIGQIRFYDIYRSDPANPTPVRIASLSGAPPATTFDDVVDSSTTFYNTVYTYFIRSVDINGTVSGASNTAGGIVKHLFIAADNQVRVYGDVNPATFTFTTTGQDPGLSGTTTCATTATPSSDVGSYPITCSGLTPTLGVTYTNGLLRITQRPITVTASTNTKIYDATASASSIPAITAGALAAGNIGAFTETYDNKNAGTGKTLIPSGTVRNGGADVTADYSITFVPANTGVISPAPLTITAVTNTKTYDATTSAAATPTVSGLKSGDTVTGLAETYNDANAGTAKTLSVSAYTILDGNGGGNYTVTTKSVTMGVINKANAVISITPYNVFYDGVAHTASGTATGVVGENVIGLDVSGTTHITAGDYPTDPWFFTSPNYNSASGTIPDHIAGFAATGSMGTARSFHTATLLPGGKVLVVGGFSSSGAPLASAELYNPSLRTFSATANNMPNKAAGHTATLLPNGQVLVVGGGNSSSQIYDPSSNTWSSAGGLSGQRTHHTATLLPNGKVLIAGGSDNSGKTTSTALLYDPSTGRYVSTGNMTVSRDFHTATVLPDGKVLIAGGRSGSGSSYTYLSSAEIYDPAAGVFAAVGSSMSSVRYGHTAIALANGQVLIAGGANSTALSSANLYDPVAGTFSVTGSLTTARQYFTATLFGGTVVVAGGLNGSGGLSSAEQYQGNVFQSAGNMTAARAAHTATLLNDGSVLITGGQGSSGASVSTAELLK